jgi:putative FmdB family regulatory protein
MPIYEYQCSECGLRFEKLFRSIQEVPEQPCAECGKPAQKLVSAVSFQFVHKQGLRGALPSNTGTSDDWNFDKAIGRDAEKKWSHIEERNSGKDGVIRDERRAGRVVSRDQLVPKSDGSGYRVIKEGERVRANQHRETAAKIAKAAKKGELQ